MKLFQIKKSLGLSMIELLIGISIGIFVTATAVSVVVASKEAQTLVKVNSRLQDRARIASRIIERDILLSGFQGCINYGTTSINVLAKEAPPDFTLNALKGYRFSSGVWESGPDSGISPSWAIPNPVSGSDAITILRGTADAVYVVDPVTANSSETFITDNNMGFAEGQMVLISDCGSGDIVELTSVTNSGSNVSLKYSSSKNLSNYLSKVYRSDAKVMRFIDRTYVVANTGRTDRLNEPINALYRVSTSGVSEELVEGIDAIRFKYGVRLNNGNLSFKGARNNSINWLNVEVVQISILISSLEHLRRENDTGTYIMAGDIFEPNRHYKTNRRLRKSFNTTIQIRNRI